MTPSLFWVTPFVLLLLAIAVFPLVRKHWWDRNYPFFAIGLGLCVAAYYLFGLQNPHSLLRTLHEYVSFISLIGSLYVVAGGIHIQVKGEATPLENCVFLSMGSVFANLIGTTGASMVLIRPWIRMNKYRLTTHHIVFFIFILSNIGGGLTPIGDPPLFLGYLKGVPFFWVLQNVGGIWLFTMAAVLGSFFWVDSRNFKKAPASVRARETAQGESWRIQGSHNVFFLLLILVAVFIQKPPFLREAIMGLCAFLSTKTTPKSVHEQNEFSFGPIQEVAILFLGIFATMIPALEWLEENAQRLGLHTPGQFFWACGTLSSVLDNAPTYLSFLSAAFGLLVNPQGAGVTPIQQILAQYPDYLRAISTAAVFFGAMTYIGNGPNFLVKSLAEQQKVKMPSFFGYVFRYSLPFLLPVFGIIWFLFFRR